MEDNKEIINELMELTPLLVELQKKHPYSISPDYFDNLPHHIYTKLYSPDPLLDLPKQSPYSTPSGYFDELPVAIKAKIEKLNPLREVQNELEEIAPLLNTINKKPIYTVPPLYFDLPINPIREPEATEKKTLKLGTRTKILRYAAAAVFIAIVSTLIIFNPKTERNTVKANNTQTGSRVQKLTEQEIITFIGTTSPSENLPSTINSPAPKNGDITISVSKIPDEEIKKFLQENGVEVEM